MRIAKIATVAVFGFCVSSAVSAQEIRFKFNNPSFGGNSFNSSHLLGLAEIQQQHEDPIPDRSLDAGNDASAAFIRQLESRLLSALASDLVDQITDATPGTDQSVTVGDQQIDFSRTEDELTVVITSLLTGAQTELILPTGILEY